MVRVIAIPMYFIGIILSPFIGVLATYIFFKDANNIHEGEIGMLMCIGAIISMIGFTIIPLLLML